MQPNESVNVYLKYERRFDHFKTILWIKKLQKRFNTPNTIKYKLV